MVNIIIREGQRGLAYRDGVLVEYLRPGRYRKFALFRDYDVETVEVGEGIRALTPELERVLPSDEAIVLDVPADHAALVTRNEQPFRVLFPGRYVLWQIGAVVETELVGLTELRAAIPQEFWALAGRVVLDVLVLPFERALVYADGELVEVLGAGRIGLSTWNRKLEIERVDLREQELQVAGQELVTRDKVSLRLNLLLNYRIVDAVASVQTVHSLHDALYAEVQVTARNTVAGVTVDELLERRAELAKAMITSVADRAKDWGVEVRRLELKDVILPGDMKTLMNRVIEAEKRAAAQVITRREETAATRSLANTARLLENNPVLLKLKEAEAWKEIAERIPNLTVIVAPKDLQDQLRLGTKD